mgnify:CR=1 FL=1
MPRREPFAVNTRRGATPEEEDIISEASTSSSSSPLRQEEGGGIRPSRRPLANAVSRVGRGDVADARNIVGVDATRHADVRLKATRRALLEALQRQNDEHGAEVRMLMERIGALEADVCSAVAVIREHEETIRSLDDELQGSREARKGALDELAAIEAHFHKARREHDNSKHVIQGLYDDLHRARQDTALAEHDCEALRGVENRNADLLRVISERDSTISELRGLVHRLKCDDVELRGRLAVAASDRVVHIKTSQDVDRLQRQLTCVIAANRDIYLALQSVEGLRDCVHRSDPSVDAHFELNPLWSIAKNDAARRAERSATRRLTWLNHGAAGSNSVAPSGATGTASVSGRFDKSLLPAAVRDVVMGAMRTTDSVDEAARRGLPSSTFRRSGSAPVPALESAGERDTPGGGVDRLPVRWEDGMTPLTEDERPRAALCGPPQRPPTSVRFVYQ